MVCSSFEKIIGFPSPDVLGLLRLCTRRGIHFSTFSPQNVKIPVIVCLKKNDEKQKQNSRPRLGSTQQTFRLVAERANRLRHGEEQRARRILCFDIQFTKPLLRYQSRFPFDEVLTF